MTKPGRPVDVQASSVPGAPPGGLPGTLPGTFPGAPPGGRRRGEAGFTLFEVMVAFVIAALALGVLFAGGLAGLRTAKIADGYGDGLARARSRIAAIVAPQPLDTSGDDGGGYRFHLRITQAGVVTPAHDESLGQALGQATTRVGLYDISVVVSWHGDGGERQVALATQRLGIVPPAGP